MYLVTPTFRNDDVTINTDLYQLSDIYAVIRDFIPGASLWSCVTVFAEDNNTGAVYSRVPFKNMPARWFYNADKIMDSIIDIPGNIIASHGLYHVDHSAISHDAQEMSIVGSCNFLHTDKFVPPFNRYNEDTIKICNDNGIYLATRDEWKSLEHEKYMVGWFGWYFHAWRFNADHVKKALLDEYSFKKQAS